MEPDYRKKYGEPKVRSLLFLDHKPADEITFRVFVVRIPNFQGVFGHEHSRKIIEKILKNAVFRPKTAKI